MVFVRESCVRDIEMEWRMEVPEMAKEATLGDESGEVLTVGKKV